MLRPDIGLNYGEFLETINEEDRELIESYYNRSELRKKGLDKVRFINDNLNIIVFTKPSCKDAASTIPYLLKLASLNDRIKISFLNREGNEKLLLDATGEEKVPSFVIVDYQGETIRKYIEFPKGVKEFLLTTKVEDTQSVIDTMREGKYDDLIQEDLVRFLTGENYEYIRFDRKDK